MTRDPTKNPNPRTKTLTAIFPFISFQANTECAAFAKLNMWVIMIEMKKVVSYFLLTVFVVAVLAFAYLFVTKGYSGSKIAIQDIARNITNEVNPTNTQELGNITSDKISLIVTSPKNGDVLGSTNAVVTGKTSQNADVFVNDIAGKADVNGNFSISIGLDEGSNLIVVLANDADGNAAEQDLTVTVTSF